MHKENILYVRIKSYASFNDLCTDVYNWERWKDFVQKYVYLVTDTSSSTDIM